MGCLRTSYPKGLRGVMASSTDLGWGLLSGGMPPTGGSRHADASGPQGPASPLIHSIVGCEDEAGTIPCT